MMIKTSPMMETMMGMVSSPRIMLNPVAIINMKPKTTKGSDKRGNILFFIGFFHIVEKFYVDSINSFLLIITALLNY